ncbi:MAG: hypothetical protein ACK5JM_06865 [Rhodoblastus sp.]
MNAMARALDRAAFGRDIDKGFRVSRKHAFQRMRIAPGFREKAG